MANIDLSSKLKKETTTITLAEGVVLNVDTSADTYLIFQEKYAKKAEADFSVDDMYEMIKTLCGDEGVEKVKAQKLTMKGLENVVIAISALVAEVDFEEMEKRFQQFSSK